MTGVWAAAPPSARVLVAALAYVCRECGDDIEPGDTYLWAGGTHTCAGCEYRPHTSHGLERYPLGPLKAFLGPLSGRQVAGACGVTPRTVWRWAHTGLTDRQADRVATRLGQHMDAIWPDGPEPVGVNEHAFGATMSGPGSACDAPGPAQQPSLERSSR